MSLSEANKLASGKWAELQIIDDETLFRLNTFTIYIVCIYASFIHWCVKLIHLACVSRRLASKLFFDFFCPSDNHLASAPISGLLPAVVTNNSAATRGLCYC